MAVATVDDRPMSDPDFQGRSVACARFALLQAAWQSGQVTSGIGGFSRRLVKFANCQAHYPRQTAGEGHAALA